MARSRKPAHESAGDQARRTGARYEDIEQLRSAVESKAGALPDNIWSQISPVHRHPYDAGELEDCLAQVYASDWWGMESRDRVRAVFNALGGEFMVIDARYARLAAIQLGEHLARSDWRLAPARLDRPVTERQLVAIGRLALLAAFGATALGPREDARNQFFSNSILERDAEETGGLREFLEGLSTNLSGTLARVAEEARRDESSVVRRMAQIDSGVQRIIKRRRFEQMLQDWVAGSLDVALTLDEFFEGLNTGATWEEQAIVAKEHFGVSYSDVSGYAKRVKEARRKYPEGVSNADSLSAVEEDEAEYRAFTAWYLDRLGTDG